MRQQQGEEYPEEGGGKDTILLHTAVDRDGGGRGTIEQHCSLHVLME